MRYCMHLTITSAIVLLAGCTSLSHYADFQSREIKALSASDIDGLRNARGMGLALAAELNGYPGPLHVLELADRLALTAEQRHATASLFARMKADALNAGEELILAERDLDRLFATRAATPPQLTRALARVAEVQARLRGTHLQAHLEQTRILTAEQVANYNALRGYAVSPVSHKRDATAARTYALLPPAAPQVDRTAQ